MKAILSYELPGEEQQHREALNGSTAHSILRELDNYLSILESSNDPIIDTRTVVVIKNKFDGIKREKEFVLGE